MDDKLMLNEETQPIATGERRSNNANYQATGSSASSVASIASSQSGFGLGSVSDGNDIELRLNAEADQLSSKLVACGNNEAMERLVLNKSLSLGGGSSEEDALLGELRREEGLSFRQSSMRSFQKKKEGYDRSMVQRVIAMVSLALLGLMIIVVLLQIGTLIVGPPSQPIGPYKLVEIQEGEDFFNHYTFYSGKDSEGSNGYINYVDREKAAELNIANVTYEPINPNEYGSGNDKNNNTEKSNDNSTEKDDEPFVYMSTSPTDEGPRNSIRLEGLKRYNRGLFILDVRHMPAGCATWPAFWLTDEPNWPVNGEIDILEGVNDQTVVKTALHSTMDCKMDDVPLGVKTGSWDTAVGVPKKNGELDMTIREAKDCYVYDPHQWLNQGCVAVSDEDGTIGEPLNKKGGGIFVLEWDPINKHISSFVFTPHSTVPENLRDTLRTASESDLEKRVDPDPRLWGLPYAYFPIGQATQCSADHFRNMHIIFNMALCGSVAGNRFFKDCPLLKKKYGTCEKYVAANTPEMEEVYWKVRGVYVYEREWERAWLK